jgi:hypothetical protein
LLVTRIANAALGLALGALGMGFCLDRPGSPTGVPLVAGAGVSAAAGLLIAIRGYRMGARYGPDGIEVRGYILSRRIEKKRITDITSFPAVRWTTAAGRRRWTPIIAFAGSAQTLPFVAKHNEACIDRLQNWDDKRRLRDRRNPAKKRRSTRRRKK